MPRPHTDGVSGNYHSVPQYSYVGEGMGCYAKEEVLIHHGWKVRRSCWALLFTCLGLLLIVVVVVIQTRMQRIWVSGQTVAPERRAFRKTYTCDMVCAHRGQRASCSARIQWAAVNRFRSSPNPCSLAYGLVLGECLNCRTNCLIEITGCKDPTSNASSERDLLLLGDANNTDELPQRLLLGDIANVGVNSSRSNHR